jgi:hypothetical protein
MLILRQEFSSEVLEAIDNSAALDKSVHIYDPISGSPQFAAGHTKPYKACILYQNGPEYNAFWQRYAANKILTKKANFVEELEHVYRAAIHLRLYTHPTETRENILHNVLRQYIFAYFHEPLQVLPGPNDDLYRPEGAWYDGQHFLTNMAIRNGFPDIASVVLEGLNSAPEPRCAGGISGDTVPFLAAGYGCMELVARVLSHPEFDTSVSLESRANAIYGAIRAGRLDVLRLALHSRRIPGSKNDGIAMRHLQMRWMVSGMLKSSLVDFCSQLFGLLASLPPKNPPILPHPGNDELLHDVAFVSPQRVDVVEWLLEQGCREHTSRNRSLQDFERLVIHTNATPGTLYDKPSEVATRG